MSPFQVIIYGVAQSLGELLPLGSAGPVQLIAHALGWPKPPAALQGYFTLGVLSAVFVYFIHDWASMISSFLGVLIFRKKPMTPDERLPFFILLSALPTAVSWYYLRNAVPESFQEPHWIALSTALLGIPLLLGEMFSRRSKSMFDWNWLDSLVLGFAQLLALIPGSGRLSGALGAAMLRNYGREAAAKFTFLAIVPLLAGEAALHFQPGLPEALGTTDAPLSGLTVGIALAISFLSGLLVIGGFMKSLERRKLTAYALYRLGIAGALAGALWLRSRGILLP